MRKTCSLVVTLLLVLPALPPAVLAAGEAGSLEILVTDVHGKPLPGATVTIVHDAGLVGKRSIVTDTDGVAEFPVLRVGRGYTIEVTFPGFGSRRLVDIEVRKGRATRLTVQLAAALEERVALVAEAAPLRQRMALGGIAKVKTYAAAPPPGPSVEGLTALVPHETESYDHQPENPFRAVTQHPLSTFSIDVDTASYANVRRILGEGRMPPAGAVRIEEMINYFDYNYPGPRDGEPFGVEVEIASAPWKPAHRLARIGIQAESIAEHARPPSNLVFLLDVSGSMAPPNKLPLLKSAMKMLVENLSGDDTVTIVVYASASGMVLPPTPAADTAAIVDALDRLGAGGSTAGGAGIRLAYAMARENFIPGGINRVILATDGDFNVGVTDRSELVKLVRAEAESSVFLTVLGFGTGNLKDATMEQLADRGNGNYAYIDSELEARKVLVEEVGGTLVTVAKDVKIQVEFNPARVAAYRLIGYENRMLSAEDFNDDRKDAGEIGSGHSVTALYEIVPAGVEIALPGVDALKYQQPREAADAADSGESFTLKIRYKQPGGDTSRLLSFPVADADRDLGAASDDFVFAAAVAGFGMLLRGSEHAAGLDVDAVVELARRGAARDASGYRAGFLELVEQARGVLDQPAEFSRP